MLDSICGSSTVRNSYRSFARPTGGFTGGALTSSQGVGEVNGSSDVAKKAGYLYDSVGVTSL
jgi:hypothetical protein